MRILPSSVSAGVLLAASFVLRIAAAPPASSPPADAEPRFEPAALREDFGQLYRQLQEAHFDLYAYADRRRVDALHREMEAALDAPLTRLEAKVRFELFASRFRMGHTRVESPMAEWRRHLASGGRSFPLQLRIVDGRSHVAANLSGVAGPAPGDELLSIDGVPMGRWLERAERHVSAETDYLAHSLMEYDFALYHWVEAGAPASYDLVFRNGSSAPRRMRLPARTQAELDAARTAQPPVLDTGVPLRLARMLDARVAYLRPGPFYNADARTAADQWDVSGFRSFIDGAFATFAKAGADRLIIDLRGNPGGDNLFSDVLIAWIATRPFRFASAFRIRVSETSTAANAARIARDAEAAGPISRRFAELYSGVPAGTVVDFEIPLAHPRSGGGFRGPVFVLIDRQSYSNAVAVAATIQDYRFGTVCGEETADLATTYGAMEQFRLRHTGLMVGYPKARIIRPNGDLRARGVTPDFPIRTPIVQGPEDSVLQETVAFAKRHPSH